MPIPVVILAGGLGTRLREETEFKPKPMVEVGGRPILWHVMKMYAVAGFDHFTICLGYKGDIIKEFFMHYHLKSRSITIDLSSGSIVTHDDALHDKWNVTLLDTGANTMTGGRVKRAALHLGRQRFAMTYGDGVSDVDLKAVLAYHKKCGKFATISAVRPPARFGGLSIVDGHVVSFEEKPQVGEGWINGGFMIFEPEVVDFIDGDATVLEREPLERLAKEGQLAVYQHERYWQCMDTVRDLTFLRELWDSNAAPWKTW